MLNVINENNEYLTQERRKEIFLRALHTVPFFTRLDFLLTIGTTKLNQFNSQTQINYDFFVTEMASNFGEVFTDTGTLFNASVWTANQISLYGYQAGTVLPTGFLFNEARFNTALGAQIFDDRQFEYEPIFIKSNNLIHAKIENVEPKSAESEAVIVIKGFNVQPSAYLSNRETQQINASLDKNTRYEYFTIEVDREGFHVYELFNDGLPRLVLGMGVTNSTATKGLVSQSEVLIKDVSRKIQLMTEPIPIDFLAPRLTCLLDQYIYWLPIEYYLQPFANLNFEITNTSPDQEDLQGYALEVLTRTI